MAAPAFSIVRRGEQPFDDSFVSAGLAISNEIFDFLDCRRQADQIETEPAYQGRAICLRRGFEIFPFEPRQDKIIN